MNTNNSTLTTENTHKIEVADLTISGWPTMDWLPRLRISRFVHKFTREDVVALYHSLTHQVIYLNDDMHQNLMRCTNGDTLSSLDQHISHFLIKQGFLVSPEYDEYRIITKVCDSSLNKPAFGILYLLLTDLCNLACHYCFVEGAMPNNHEFQYMKEETAISGINLFAKLIQANPPDRRLGRPSIILYGGEPLLNPETFIAATNAVEEMKHRGRFPDDLSVLLLTNGTVINEAILDQIVKCGINVSVSMDGPEGLHDANRVYKDNGAGSFKKVTDNVKKMQERGINVSASCTINPANVANLENVFNWLVEERKITGLGFNLLLDLPGTSQADANYVAEATNKIIECYKIAREMGIYEDRIMRKIKAFVKKYLHTVDCGGCGNQIVVAPDGRVGPCQAYMGSSKFFPGNVNDKQFNPFIDTTFREWSRRSPFNTPSCYFCEAIGLCGGGCAYNADLKTGSIWQIDSNFCVHSKQILHWLIWDLFAKSLKKGGDANDATHSDSLG